MEREKRGLPANGAEPLTAITVTVVGSLSLAAEREAAKLLAPATETE